MKTIILAGGKGTRLWPLSRELMPKQFIKIFDNVSPFQKTVERALLLSKPKEIYIITNREYEFIVIDELEEMGLSIPRENVLLEPVGKNTLPAIYWGIKTIEEKFGNSKVAVFPSDHLIKVSDTYREAFEIAEKLADSYLITFGIKPTRAHTGYGYIKPGEKLECGYKVAEFKEKPDLETAKKYVEEGYYWNSGMFLFDTELFIEEVKKLTPEVYQTFEEATDIVEVYKKVPEISVDYGIMEKTDKAIVVPLNTYWNDLGSFDAIYEAFNKDTNGNAVKVEGIKAEYLGINSENNLIMTERLTATIGVKNLMIIDTGDALLVAQRGEGQKVKEIYEKLKQKGDERAIVHRTAYRPWGTYTLLEEGKEYKIKRMTVLPRRKLTLQRHYHRSEHWVVVSGTARVIVGEKEILLRPGESTFIPAGVFHRVENPGLIPLEIIEVQIGQYLGEDDIERLQDDLEER
ncbi:mannose-1-phosphate guanylyltransferase/mannose-6-phosphate isomerase [Thermococcus sp. MV5]|uniref:mannose-1-phosphate guanylyltransferase/mannose-6-phosphate isomerase n=1 Tax=Thermococcus sp. MV5 TaxID=1638272 RepID=UPI00143A3D54|nr:mannose-1-phosphate guanylyltransferase/mannose-6-phosphate isomerase [Thermococcus sp. MV5]NJE26121.1 mannose-1-phosphate guanylyltransferase/mannose-6-phosphate isomerase [Thermococcus sp. MV5]